MQHKRDHEFQSHSFLVYEIHLYLNNIFISTSPQFITIHGKNIAMRQTFVNYPFVKTMEKLKMYFYGFIVCTDYKPIRPQFSLAGSLVKRTQNLASRSFYHRERIFLFSSANSPLTLLL